MNYIVCADIAGADLDTYRILYEKASPERKKRAEGYRRQADALRCVTADALLRYALGTERYTEIRQQGEKPRIMERPDFHFNLSHSGRWVVLAWADAELGVDVEQIRENTDIHSLARRYFTQDEQAYLREGDARARFFDLWTRKESYLKYLGTGLTKSLSGFSVLSGETGMEFPQWELPGNYRLCLCSQKSESAVELVEVGRLIDFS